MKVERNLRWNEGRLESRRCRPASGEVSIWRCERRENAHRPRTARKRNVRLLHWYKFVTDICRPARTCVSCNCCRWCCREHKPIPAARNLLWPVRAGPEISNFLEVATAATLRSATLNGLRPKLNIYRCTQNGNMRCVHGRKRGTSSVDRSVP